jgi:hypothetical protein
MTARAKQVAFIKFRFNHIPRFVRYHPNREIFLVGVTMMELQPSRVLVPSTADALAAKVGYRRVLDSHTANFRVTAIAASPAAVR